MLSIRHDQYYSYADLTELLHDLEARHPALCRVESLGKSWEGRDVWLCTVTNQATGPDTEKPAFWVDGSIHAAELAPASACLYLVDYLLSRYFSDEQVMQCLDTRVFYICPRANPDGGEWALGTPPRTIRSSTRPWPYADEPVGEVVPDDIDGDGRVLWMRVPDPHGVWKIAEQDPRLLVRRDPIESGGQYFRIFPEGRVEGWDGLTLRARPPREGLDLNRNFPAGWQLESEQPGAGPYPTSEPEVRNLVDFIVRHPNITGGVSFHTFSGVLLRPFSHKPDDELPSEDLWTYQALGRRGTELTGYPAISVFHDFRYHPKKVITGAFDDWIYEHRGVFGWTVEIWSPRREAGLEVKDYYEWYREHPVEDDLALLRWSDQQLGGAGFVDWYPFEHPQLGRVELGGWATPHTLRNPPPQKLEAEIARFPAWLVWHLLVSPRLQLLEASASRLGPDTWRVRFAVVNGGWLPTYVTKRAQEAKLVRALSAEIELPEGAVLELGRPRVELGQLEGRAYKWAAPVPWLTDDTDDRTYAEWVVRSSEGGVVTLVARHERAGVVRAELRLE
jgi:murein tripeptide amidase MpaA